MTMTIMMVTTTTTRRRKRQSDRHWCDERGSGASRETMMMETMTMEKKTTPQSRKDTITYSACVQGVRLHYRRLGW